MYKYAITLTFTILIATCLSVSCSVKKNNSAENILRPDAIYLLLEVLQNLRDNNQDWAGWNEQLSRLDRPRQIELLDSLSMRNKQDPELNFMIDSLLSSDTYQIYYRKFGNVKPEDHREMLLRLPYGWLPSPASISENLYDICLYQDSLAYWVETVVGRIDLEKIQQTAMIWLPEGDYQLPITHFIMDGNGDAFAAEGEVVFDLYTLVLNKRPQSTRYADLAEISVEQIESVLAHEFHHVFANIPYQPTTRSSATLSSIWRNRLIRTMVSEGIAMHCNPPEGIYRTTKEDRAIVAFWFKELTQTLKQLESNEMSEKDIKQWYRDSYFETAKAQLKDYFSRSLSGKELNKKLYMQADARPTLIYTLGWWMVSHISNNGTDREAVIELLQNPYSLFSRYNAVVPELPDSLRAPQ